MSLMTIGLVVLGALLLIPLVIAFVLAQHKHLGHSPPGPLMVIALYGIGFAIAIPAWQDWRAREHLHETIRGLDAARASVETALGERGKPPATLATPAGITYDARDGSLSVKPAKDYLQGQPVRLVPAAGHDRKVTWKCTTEREPDRFRKFMPEWCR